MAAAPAPAATPGSTRARGAAERDDALEPPIREPGRGQPRPIRRAETERGLRGLVGAGPSQVGISGALRARDAARPRPEDIEAAERDLIIVRRNYVPPDAGRPET